MKLVWERHQRYALLLSNTYRQARAVAYVANVRDASYASHVKPWRVFLYDTNTDCYFDTQEEAEAVAEAAAMMSMT